MNKKDCIKLIGTAMLALTVAACGSSGGGSGNTQVGDDIKLHATALKDQTVVAAAPKTKLDTMLALFGGKEAVAAIQAGDCGAGNDARGFDLSGGSAFVCLTKALIVYEEVELENEGSAVKDEIEAGPFLVDLIGITDDIPGTITLNVPDGNFNKLEIEVGDLDDNDGNPGLHDDGDDNPNTGDDTPKNVSATIADTAGMANHSLRIEGTVHDGLGNPGVPFTFTTNIEGKMEMPITLVDPNVKVIDGSTLVTFVNLSAGFGNLTFADIQSTPTMDGSFGPTETCVAAKLAGTNKSQILACDIVTNVELFHDVNDDKNLEPGEKRGDDKGAGGGLFNDDPATHERD